MKKRIFFISCGIIAAAIFVILLMWAAYLVRYPFDYKSTILQCSQKYDLPPELVASVINTESGFKSHAVSRVGARGLMQLMPATAEFIAGELDIKEFSKDILSDPELNIEFGTWYLRYLFDKFENRDTALAAYNAGEGIVRSWLRNPELSDDGHALKKIPYAETRNFVSKVLSDMEIYKNKIK